MQIFEKLKKVWLNLDYPFIITNKKDIYFKDLFISLKKYQKK